MPEILFNYLGRIDVTSANNEQYEAADDDKGSDLYPLEIKNTLFECVIGIRQNQLFLQSSYSEEYFNVDTVNKIMLQMIIILREIIIQKDENLIMTNINVNVSLNSPN